MSAPATCATCRWWHDSGYCRRYPPVAAVSEWKQYDSYEHTAVRFLSMWPETDPDDWCDKHAPKEAE